MEALIGFRVIDIACGSGDAQTLCITDDDNVWSWGDGDYGKLGRGGSDGCKIPMKVDSLAGLGAVKVNSSHVICTSLESSYLLLFCIEIVKRKLALLNLFLEINELKFSHQHFPKEDILIYLGKYRYSC